MIPALLMLLSACPTMPADSLELVPSTASAVIGGEVDRIVGTELGKALVRGLEGDLPIGETLEVFGECGVTLDEVGEVWLARDDADGRLLFARADGIGEPETLACVTTQLRGRDRGRDPWTSASTNDCTTLDLRDGSRAWLLGSDALVWARGSMIAAVEQPDSQAGTLIAAIDRRAHAWGAATLDRPSWAVEARSLVAAVDLERKGRAGLWIDFTMSAGDLAATATLRDRVLGLLVQFADRLDALGIEHRLRERMRVGLVDGVLLGELEFDLGELQRIHAQMAGAGLF
jgi:hypothetical protein